jgi:hypothetical protein
MEVVKMTRDMGKIREGLIEYVNYRLDQIEEGVYNDSKELFDKIKQFYDKEVVPLTIRDCKDDLERLEGRFEMVKIK